MFIVGANQSLHCNLRNVFNIWLSWLKPYIKSHFFDANDNVYRSTTSGALSDDNEGIAP